MLKTYYFAKIMHKLHLSSFHHCQIDRTARVDAKCTLTDVTMGRYSYVGSRTSITKAHIGNFCSIAGQCTIGGGVHPLEAVSTSPVFNKGRNILRKNFAMHDTGETEWVEIGHDVWIGNGVYIKAGIKIGTGSVIGAHAVVTHDVAPYEIVAGVPAVPLRKRFQEEVLQKLLMSQWWLWPEEKLQQYGVFFNDPQKLLSAIVEGKSEDNQDEDIAY